MHRIEQKAGPSSKAGVRPAPDTINLAKETLTSLNVETVLGDNGAIANSDRAQETRASNSSSVEDSSISPPLGRFPRLKKDLKKLITSFTPKEYKGIPARIWGTWDHFKNGIPQTVLPFLEFDQYLFPNALKVPGQNVHAENYLDPRYFFVGLYDSNKHEKWKEEIIKTLARGLLRSPHTALSFGIKPDEIKDREKYAAAIARLEANEKFNNDIRTLFENVFENYIGSQSGIYLVTSANPNKVEPSDATPPAVLAVFAVCPYRDSNISEKQSKRQEKLGQKVEKSLEAITKEYSGKLGQKVDEQMRLNGLYTSMTVDKLKGLAVHPDAPRIPGCTVGIGTYFFPFILRHIFESKNPPEKLVANAFDETSGDGPPSRLQAYIDCGAEVKKVDVVGGLDLYEVTFWRDAILKLEKAKLKKRSEIEGMQL